MNVSEPLECPHAVDDDVLRQYARDTLTEEAAAAFEEHLFGCDRCERELRRAIEIRVALSRAETVTVSPRVVPFAERRVRTFFLSTAAVVALVLGIAFWQSRPPRPTAQEPMRGPDTLSITASGSFSGDSFTATWKPPRSETLNFAGKPLQRFRYLVQFFAEDGTTLHSVTTEETSVTAALTGPLQVKAFYWNVQALDADGVAVGRSELQKAVRPGAR
jgi:Putative zinc-finger